MDILFCFPSVRDFLLPSSFIFFINMNPATITPNSYLIHLDFQGLYSPVKDVQTRVNRIASVAKRTLVISDNTLLFINIARGTYDIVTSNLKEMQVIVTNFIIKMFNDSVDELDNKFVDEGNKVLCKIKKELLIIEENQGFSDYSDMSNKSKPKLFGKWFEWKLAMTDNTLSAKLNNDVDCIHFRNGKLHLPTATIMPRVIDLDRVNGDFISAFIDRDITDPNEDELNFIEHFMKSLIKEDEARACITSLLGASLSGRYRGESTKLLHLVGLGSNGKSSLVAALVHMLDDKIYTHRVPNNFFSSNEAVNTVIKAITPNCRFLVCEEPQINNKFKDNIIKSVVDGNWSINGTPYVVNAKLLLTSNKVPRFTHLDDGVDRRVLYCRFKNTFINPHEPLVYPSYQIYKNGICKPEVWSNSVKNTCLFYFAYHCRDYYATNNCGIIKDGIGIIQGVRRYYDVQKFLCVFCVPAAYDQTIGLDEMVAMVERVIPCYFNNGRMNATEKTDFIQQIINASITNGEQLINYSEQNCWFKGVAWRQSALALLDNNPWGDLSNFIRPSLIPETVINAVVEEEI